MTTDPAQADPVQPDPAQPDPAAAAPVHTRAIVRGQVQGVGFRFYTQREARRLGLAGFVRNRLDGSVQVDVQGPPAAVALLLQWLQTGPPAATVTSVTLTDVVTDAPAGPDFEISY